MFNLRSVFILTIAIVLFAILLVPTLIFLIILKILSLFGYRPKWRFKTTGWEFHYSSNKAPGHQAEEKMDQHDALEKGKGEYVDFEEIK